MTDDRATRSHLDDVEMHGTPPTPSSASILPRDIFHVMLTEPASQEFLFLRVYGTVPYRFFLFPCGFTDVLCFET